MDNGIGRPPVLLTFWRRLGAWVDRSAPKEGLTAQIFFTISVVLGTALCFGFRPVLTGLHDWLQWRLASQRTTSPPATSRFLPRTIRRQAKDRPLPVAKRVQPRALVAPEEFFHGEELVLDGEPAVGSEPLGVTSCGAVGGGSRRRCGRSPARQPA